MNIKVLKEAEALSAEEAVDVKGGLNPALNLSASACTCDCFIGNKNETTQDPSKPIKTPNV